MRALLAALALCVGLACAVRAETVRVGYQKTGTLVIVRQQHRLEAALKPAGLTVQWAEFQSGPTLLEAMNAGAVDLGYTGDTPPVFAQAGGVDLLYLARLPVGGRDEGVVVAKASPMRSLADLRGKRVAFTKGSSAQYMTAKLLETAGLSMRDIHPAYLAPADAAAALRAGGVDAWSIWDPFFAVAQQNADWRTLADGEAAPTSAFLVVRRPFALTRPDVALTFLAVVNQAAAWSQTHQDELAGVMAAVTGVNLGAEKVAAARGSYHYDLLTKADVARQQGLADTLAALHVIPAKVDVGQIVWTPPAHAKPIGE